MTTVGQTYVFYLPNSICLGNLRGNLEDVNSKWVNVVTLREERDYYRTPEEALIPLLKHIDYITYNFIEPCAGDGTLTSLLLKYTDGKCLYQSDIEPQEKRYFSKKNVLDIEDKPDYYITNPPWDRKLLHPIIEHLS